MKSDRYYNGSNYSYYWSNPWHYCYYCGKCHDEDKRHCDHYRDELQEDHKEKPGREVDGEEYYRGEVEYPKKLEGRREWVREIDFGWNEEHDSEEHKEKPHSEHRPHPEKQTHVHEFEGSTKLAEFEEDVHNHRTAGITGEAVKFAGGHVHKIWTRTDFFDHFHYIQQFTGPAIYVDKDVKDVNDDEICEEPHIHFIKGLTTVNDGHAHEYQLTTAIDSPLLPDEELNEEKQ